MRLTLQHEKDEDELRLARRSLALLARATELLTSPFESGELLNKLAWLVVPDLADCCAVYLAQSGRRMQLAALAYAHPSHASLARSVEQSPLAFEDHPQRSSNELHLPMRAGGRTLGFLRLLVTGERRFGFGQVEMSVAQQLADAFAMTLDRTMLAKEAREALGVRDKLLAATSHELRTPLAHIKGFASSLRRPDVDWDEGVREDFLAEVEREADRLDGLITDMLTMAGLESGASEQQLMRVAPSALIADGLDRVRSLLADARVEVDTEADLPSVLVDAVHMEHVIASIVENAIKHGSPRAHVRVTACRAHGDLEIAVEDDGVGISEQHRERVFEKFYRALPWEQSGVPGTGLGLAICRAIVQNHGGRIWAEAAQSGGARVVMRIPL